MVPISPTHEPLDVKSIGEYEIGESYVHEDNLADTYILKSENPEDGFEIINRLIFEGHPNDSRIFLVEDNGEYSARFQVNNCNVAVYNYCITVANCLENERLKTRELLEAKLK
ncbi:hypothetical protein HOE04_03775 [archaeon]|jgi:hypothetical protein|nr:hypothetical protein [archaeon]